MPQSLYFWFSSHSKIDPIVWTMEKEIEHVTSRSSETSSSEVQELSDEGSKKKIVENEEIDDRVYDSGIYLGVLFLKSYRNSVFF